MRTCEACQRELEEKQFYFSQRYRLKVCKDCIKSDFNAEDRSSYMWVLRELDMPFISQTWRMLKRGAEAGGRSLEQLLGKYIAIMHLPAFRLLTWEDSDEGVR